MQYINRFMNVVGLCQKDNSTNSRKGDAWCIIKSHCRTVWTVPCSPYDHDSTVQFSICSSITINPPYRPTNCPLPVSLYRYSHFQILTGQIIFFLHSFFQHSSCHPHLTTGITIPVFYCFMQAFLIKKLHTIIATPILLFLTICHKNIG